MGVVLDLAFQTADREDVATFQVVSDPRDERTQAICIVPTFEGTARDHVLALALHTDGRAEGPETPPRGFDVRRNAPRS